MQGNKLNILYVEPFYSGSHKKWIDDYSKFSNHNIEILSLPGKKWKWRMHGGAISLAKEYNNMNIVFDIILCSDMLNLPVFKSLCNDNLSRSKVLIYFHENQLSYPWSPNDKDLKLDRDLNYYYINYTSSLISDYNYFNSQYHLDSYINGLRKYLKKMPDFRNLESIDLIKKKSSVLPIGCNLSENNLKKIEHPIILWNHRWEYDKNPKLFFETLFELNDLKIDFSLIILGENYSEYPKIFDTAKDKLNNKIIHFGYCENYTQYLRYLKMSNILPVTSHQDFFGISVVEAVSYGCYPILPKRLTYPDLFNYKKNNFLFYNSDLELKDKLVSVIKNIKNYSSTIKEISQEIFYKFNWKNISKKYDSAFEKQMG
tara:strand:+ start:493 stop:1608 length:1116 start_codon:yes stop_codon:yes gene_type:complete